MGDTQIIAISRHGARWRFKWRGQWSSHATLEEAQRERDRLVGERERQRHVIASTYSDRVTVGAIVQRWFEGPPGRPELAHDRKRRLSPSTKTEWRRLIRKHIAKLADVDAWELIADPMILEEFFHETVVSPINAKHCYTILNLAFKASMRGTLGVEYRLPTNPCQGQKLRPWTSPVRDIPIFDEVRRMIRAAQAEDRRWGLFVRLVATLGTRRGETVALRANDFDVRQKLVRIDETAVVHPDGSISLKPPKSWEGRVVHVPHAGFWKKMTPVLEGMQPDEFLFPGWALDPKHRDGAKCWHPSTASRRFRATIRSLGLFGRDTGKPYTLHALRHFVATTLYNQKPDWVQLARYLGHKDPSITMRLYANHVIEKTQQELGVLAAAPWWDEVDTGDEGEENDGLQGPPHVP